MDSISLLLSCFACIAPIIVVLFVIIALTRVTQRKQIQQPQQPKQSEFNVKLIEWLKSRKAEGLVSIDELINKANKGHITQKTQSSTIKQSDATIVRNTKPEVIEPIKHTVKPQESRKFIEKPHTNSLQISTAELLLYIGSFLVIFSLFVFIAFTWEIYSTSVKSIMIITFTVCFYAVGALLSKSTRLKKASVTFITIGAVAVAFTGIGLWNFGLFENTSITFPIYWTIYGIILSLIYFLSLKAFGQKRYFYLGILVIYSLMGSLSFSITEDPRLRIIIIALLNVIFYGSEKLFGKLSKEVRIASRSVNLVFDFLIAGVIISLLSGISSHYSQTMASAALLIPTFGYIVAWIKEKGKGELYWGVITILLKVFLIGVIFALSPSQMIILMVIASTSIVAISKVFWNREKEMIHVLWIEHFLTTIIAALAVFTIGLMGKNSWLEVSTVVLFSVPLGLHLFNYLKYREASIFSIKLLFIPLEVLLIGYGFNFNLTGFLSLIIGLYLIFEIVQILLSKQKKVLYNTSRVISLAINGLMIISAVTLFSASNSSNLNRILAILLLSLPVLSTFIKSPKDFKYEHIIELLLLPIKFVVLTAIIHLFTKTSIGLFLSFILTYAIILQFLTFTLYKGQKILKNLSVLISWGLIGVVTLLVISTYSSNVGFYNVPKWLQITSLLVSSATLIVPAFIRRQSALFSIALIYIIGVIPWITTIISPKAPYSIYLTEFIVIFTVSTTLYFLSKTRQKIIFNAPTYLPAVIISGIITLMIGISNGSGALLVSFSLITLAFHIIGYLANNKTSRFISVVCMLSTHLALVSWVNSRHFLNISWPVQTGAALLIPGAIYLILSETRNFANKYADEFLTGFIAFTGLGVLLTFGNGILFLISLSVLLIYSVYFCTRYKNPSFAYSIALLSYMILLQSSSIWHWKGEITALSSAIFSTILIVISNKKIIGNLISEEICSALDRSAIIASIVILFAIFPGNFNNATFVTIITAFICAAIINSSERTALKLRIAGGLGYVLGIWCLATIIEGPTQLYVLPFVAYLFCISWIYSKKGDKNASSAFEFAGVGIETSVLFLQSVLSSGDGEKILYGIILIVISSILIILGIQLKKRALLAIGIIFMALELFVRLSFVIVSIPWWIYLGLAGLGLIVSAIYQLLKSTKKS